MIVWLSFSGRQGGQFLRHNVYVCCSKIRRSAVSVLCRMSFNSSGHCVREVDELLAVTDGLTMSTERRGSLFSSVLTIRTE